MYGSSFGYDFSLGNNSSLFNLESAGIWVIISFVIALVGGICLYFTVFSDKNEKSYLVTSENPNNKYFVGAGTGEKSLNEAEKTLQMYTKDSLQKHNVKDEKKNY